MSSDKPHSTNIHKATSTKLKPKTEKSAEEELIDILKRDPSTMNPEERNDYEIVKKLNESFEASGSTNTVLCQTFLNSVQEINSSTQTALIDIGIQLWWMDVDAKGCVGDIKNWEDKFDCWIPILEIMNNMDVEPVLEDRGSFYIRDEYSKYGVVNWYQRFKGSIYLQHDLREFPFDRQIFRIKFGATLWSADYITLRDMTPPGTKALFSAGMNFTEWELVSDPAIEESVVYSIEDHRPISYLELSFKIRRKSSYYLTHVVFMIFLINIMSWTIFTLADNIASRLSLDITLFLALVALNFVVIGFIPKVTYTTTLSTYFVVSYTLLTFSTLHNVAIYLIQNYYCTPDEGDPRYLIGISNATSTGEPGKCWTALYYDWIILFFVAIGTLIYTLYFVIKGSKNRPGEVIHQIRQAPASPSIYDDLPLQLETE